MITFCFGWIEYLTAHCGGHHFSYKLSNYINKLISEAKVKCLMWKSCKSLYPFPNVLSGRWIRVNGHATDNGNFLLFYALVYSLYIVCEWLNDKLRAHTTHANGMICCGSDVSAPASDCCCAKYANTTPVVEHNNHIYIILYIIVETSPSTMRVLCAVWLRTVDAICWWSSFVDFHSTHCCRHRPNRTRTFAFRIRLLIRLMRMCFVYVSYIVH